MSEPTTKSTYATFAEAFLDEERRGSRIEVNKPIHTATNPVYPELPSNSPFHHDPVGQEPPLGFSVEDHAPVGTAKEIAASLERLGSTDFLPGQPDGGATEAPASSTPPCADAVETVAPPTFTDEDEPPRAA